MLPRMESKLLLSHGFVNSNIYPIREALAMENFEALDDAAQIEKFPIVQPEYNLPGVQVEPAASYWNAISSLHTITLAELCKATSNPDIRSFFPPYPIDSETLHAELVLLKQMELLRDKGQQIVTEQDIKDVAKVLQSALDAQVPGKQLKEFLPEFDVRSRFLGPELRAYQTPDAVYQQVPPLPDGVVDTATQLARYFQHETPGLAHRLALNLLLEPLRDRWSPPRHALIWAALDVAVSSALMAAWYYKWLSPRPNTSRRVRPIEALIPKHATALHLNVLFDTAVTNKDPDHPVSPTPGPAPSPGTPRHPAYPSGHSTYSAAASTVLAHFFPDQADEFKKLANNIGIARLWAGVHWPSDHTAGARLGRVIGGLVIRQISKIPVQPAVMTQIPTRAALQAEGEGLGATFPSNC